MFQGEKIDYTNYLKGKPPETNLGKMYAMGDAAMDALQERGISGSVSLEYYADGCVRVSVNGEYYGMFDFGTKKFFEGPEGTETEKG